MEELSQNKIWKLYRSLSPELREMMSSEDTAETIDNICRLHEYDDIKDIIQVITNVFLGLLPPDLFLDTLIEDLNIEKGVAQKISMEIEHYIFNPVKSELNKLYKIESVPEEVQQKNLDSYRETLK